MSGSPKSGITPKDVSKEMSQTSNKKKINGLEYCSGVLRDRTVITPKALRGIASDSKEVEQ